MDRIRTLLTTLVLGMGFLSWTAQAQTIMTATANGPNGSHDDWNLPANWTAGVPSGAVSAVVNAGLSAEVWNDATPAYSGTLTLNNNATVQLGWTNPQRVNSLNALGAGVIMNTGSQVRLRMASPNPLTLPPLTLAGDASVHLSPSTSAHHRTRIMEDISGAGALTVIGNNNNTLRLNTSANPTWSGGFVADSDNVWRVEANVSGAFGTGNVTINNNATLEVNAADVIDDAATLALNGAKDSRRTAKLLMAANDTVSGFWLDGVDQGYGAFSAATHPGVIGDTGVLTVPVPPVVDFDGDGFDDPVDWDDGDATVYPGAPELPDLKDNNQNGSVDDGLTPTNVMNTDTGGDISWLLGSNWSLDHMPGANDSAIVSNGLTAQVTSLPSGFDYAGTLTLEENATLRINNTGGNTNLDALGNGGIILHDGTKISLPTSADPHFPAIHLEGAATTDNPSNAADHDNRYFDGPISGPGSLRIVGRNNNTYELNATNTFSGGLTADGGGWRLEANAPGALGTGDVTINSGVSLIFNADDVMGDFATLFLNGGRDNRRASKLILNGSDTIAALFLDGVDLGTGIFDATSGLVDINGLPLITGDVDFFLEVTGIFEPPAQFVIPEPSTGTLLGLAMLCLVGLAKRRRA